MELTDEDESCKFRNQTSRMNQIFADRDSGEEDPKEKRALVQGRTQEIKSLSRKKDGSETVLQEMQHGQQKYTGVVF